MGLITEQPLDSKERNFYLSLCSVLKDKNIIIYDIGAADGITARCFAKLTNVSTIYAFEPIPEAYAKLVENVKTFPKISCYNVAIGKVEDTLAINVSSNSNSSSLLLMLQLHQKEFPDISVNTRIEIPVVRLDNYVQRNNLAMPDIVKIDVQGYEMMVIEGGIQTISQAKYCIIEMSFQPLYDGSPLFDDIYNIMIKLGFILVGVTSPLIGESEVPMQVDGIFKKTQ